MVDFAGWEMPIVYRSIVEEHRTTRTSSSLFDVSHMGRVYFSGPGAKDLLDQLVTNSVAPMEPGQAKYALVLNEQAGVMDDVIVYRLPGEDRFLVVVNAGNREKLLPWFDAHRTSFDAQIEDDTLATAMIAVQGPKAIGLLSGMFDVSLDDLRPFFCRPVSFESEQLLLCRTGYTGEDGCEIIAPAKGIGAIWETLLQAGEADGVSAAGLGARDTLRLEAGMPLFGHELTEEIDPVQAGLGWAVKANAKDFIGKQALLARPADRPVRIGLTLEGRRIAREGFPVQHNNQAVGAISSGTFSPTLEKSIAMAFVDPSLRAAGTILEVDVRQTMVPATVTRLPFYQRQKP